MANLVVPMRSAGVPPAVSAGVPPAPHPRAKGVETPAPTAAGTAALPRHGHGHPQTPPWLEQQPRLFAQLKQVGERVPSQQRRPPAAGGSLTTMISVRVGLPQAPPDVVSVIVSVPARVAL